MTRNIFARVAVAAVLVVALSTAGAYADCSADTAVCVDGYVFSTAADPGSALCDGTTCETSTTGHTACCVATLCTNLATDYCPYGYVAKPKGSDTAVGAALHMVDTCCVDASKTDDFPKCQGGIGGASALQAQDSGDTNWAVHDGNGFTKTVGAYTGMCFSLTIANDCAYGNEATKAKCCTRRPFTHLQFKIPVTAGAPASRTTALAALNKCKVSYGSDVANVRALKRLSPTAWINPVGDDTQYVNIPVTFKRGQKQATVCLYSLNAAPGGIDCSWSNLCGIDTDPATAAALGCELRMVGKATAASSACCSPTLSIDAFENSESRLADGAPATQTIELLGV